MEDASSSRSDGAADDGRVTLLVFGDSYVADPLVQRTWPILLADRLGWRSANFAAPSSVENNASAAQAADWPRPVVAGRGWPRLVEAGRGWPRLAEARGSLRHALPREEASGAPAGRGLSHLVLDPGAREWE